MTLFYLWTFISFSVSCGSTTSFKSVSPVVIDHADCRHQWLVIRLLELGFRNHGRRWRRCWLVHLPGLLLSRSRHFIDECLCLRFGCRYWTRPSFTKEVDETEWNPDQMVGAQSFHGLPEGLSAHQLWLISGGLDLALNDVPEILCPTTWTGTFFKNDQDGYDLLLNVERLAITDDYIVKYDPTDATHRQLLASRGWVNSEFVLVVLNTLYFK